jgi:hypothetical protein
MVAQSTEKRGFSRVPFNTQVEVRAKGRLIRSQEGVNISMSGIRLTTAEAIPPAETPCQVTIVLGGMEHPVIIEAKGKMVQSQEGSLAVEFTELDLDSYHHLQQLIINNADDPERAEQEFTAHWGIRKPQR